MSVEAWVLVLDLMVGGGLLEGDGETNKHMGRRGGTAQIFCCSTGRFMLALGW